MADYLTTDTDLSRPVRARGLKPKHEDWDAVDLLSRPVRARGLKHDADQTPRHLDQSRPVRARGLKLEATRAVVRERRRAPCGRVD